MIPLPVSMAFNAFISSSFRSKSKTSALDSILEGVEDLGSTIKPDCKLQRIKTWAGVLLYF